MRNLAYITRAPLADGTSVSKARATFLRGDRDGARANVSANGGLSAWGFG